MDFEETGKLGHGSFCSVFRCVRRMDGCEYAMKVSKHSVSGRMAKQRQRQEVLALAALAGCPFVVRYFSAWEEEGKQYVQVRRIARGITPHFLALTIMRWSLATLCLCLSVSVDVWMCVVHAVMQLELCEGSLADLAWGRLSRKHRTSTGTPVKGATTDTSATTTTTTDDEQEEEGHAGAGANADVDASHRRRDARATRRSRRSNFPPRGERELVVVLYHIAQALWYMHSRGMAHMDVKPANILFTHAPDTAAQSGFQRLPSGGIGPKEVTMYKLADLGQVCSVPTTNDVEEGDARYLSSERLNDDLSNLPAGDVFALGLSLYELVRWCCSVHLCVYVCVCARRLSLGVVAGVVTPLQASGERLPMSGPRYQALRRGDIEALPNFSSAFNALLSVRTLALALTLILVSDPSPLPLSSLSVCACACGCGCAPGNAASRPHETTHGARATVPRHVVSRPRRSR